MTFKFNKAKLLTRLDHTLYNIMVIKDRAVQSVLWLICFSGMLWQFYRITEQYLLYETSTLVVIDQMKELNLPHLEIGTNAPKLLIDSKSCNNMMYCGANITEYYSNSTLINYHHTPRADEIMIAKECKIRSFVTGKKVLCAKEDMRRSSMNGYMLYSLHYPTNVTTIARSKFYDDSMLFSTALNLTLFPHLTTLLIELHTKDELHNWFEKSTYHTLSFSDVKSSAEFTYDHIEISRLEYPYNTHCFDYTQVGFQSQSHCISNCFEYNYHKRFKKNANLISVSSEQSPAPRKVMVGDFSSTSNESYSLEISNHCLNQCNRQDCKKQFFSPSLKSESIAENNIVRIDVRIPSAPTTYIMYMPRMNLIDFVTYVLSYISFWLGWSPLGFLQDIYVKRIRRLLTSNLQDERSNESSCIRSSGMSETIIRRIEIEKKITDLKLNAMYSLIQAQAHKLSLIYEMP